MTRVFASNCPIREFTADNRSVGRCWFHLPDGRTCPRHGDVAIAVAKFVETGSLTDEPGYGESAGREETSNG